jgi:hypothetical protein
VFIGKRGMDVMLEMFDLLIEKRGIAGMRVTNRHNTSYASAN